VRREAEGCEGVNADEYGGRTLGSREGVRLKAIPTSVLEEISNSNTQHIQTLGIEGIQF
jgi:hypothetical protein